LPLIAVKARNYVLSKECDSRSATLARNDERQRNPEAHVPGTKTAGESLEPRTINVVKNLQKSAKMLPS
jgi:hypothetical protein